MIEVVGRQSSHYTRVVRIFAHELGIPYRLTPVLNLLAHDTETFAGNPALKLPVLRRDRDTVYGALNICRVLAGDRRDIAWPETVTLPLVLNAHEILNHALAAQVEVVLHEVVERRPPDTASKKRRRSLENCVAWLDAHLAEVREALPVRALSFFEVALYCLLTHFPFRNPLDLSAMPALTAFEREFGARPSAEATAYAFDQAP